MSPLVVESQSLGIQGDSLEGERLLALLGAVAVSNSTASPHPQPTSPDPLP